ncbi:MAG: DUF2062 domain-containing protein, partial [Proteobacteria bacterium]|nr:DUF2062 domain-containing protein [Pseudomonadota bacterium]
MLAFWGTVHMLFSRRHVGSWLNALRARIGSRLSWQRSVRYRFLQLAKLQASPVQLALGLAIGVFVAFQPIIGFQMLAAGLLALGLRASVGAALLGTFIGTP